MASGSGPASGRNGSVVAACPRCGAAAGAGARFCSACGTALGTTPPAGRGEPDGARADSGDIATPTERRQITVVFCDLVNSTALSAAVDPEDFTDIVSAFHRSVTRAMTEFGGFVARYMGDGALVYFGYPQAHEDDAERAVHAALKTVDAVAALALPGGRQLQARIGIATGVVVVGDVIGTGTLRGLDVAGATPNLAARLQSLAPADAILVADATRRLAGELFEWRDHGAVAVKGLAEPVHAWQVIAARPVSSRFEAQHADALAPMVGRDRERETLAGLWRDAQQGRGQVALISGEAGIGKSRLAAELLENLRGQAHARLRYFCSSHRQHSPLHPCVQQLEHAAGFAREDGPAERLAKLEALVGDVPQQDLQLIAELLLLPTGNRFPVLQFAPLRRRQRVMQALIGLLDRASQQVPLLVVFEDVHWSDESSRDLLAMLVARVASLRILLVVTSRPEFDARWIRQGHVTRLALGQLGAQESARLVGWIAGDQRLPRRVVDDIIARTDGVPLFLEELTQAVLEGGAGGDALAAVRSSPSVPASLHASLLARLDRLGGAREIAEVAAAVGREFTGELLTLVADRPAGEITQGLDRLVESGLVVKRAAAAPEYTEYSFRHVLIRDAAYGILLRDQRRVLHARIAEALEKHFPERAAAHPDVVAQHCTEGALIQKAVVHWLNAGVHALRRSAMSEALVHLRRGLELLRELPESAVRTRCELDLTIALGKAQIATQGYAVASTGDTFARARALCAELGDPPQVLAVLHGLWTHALMRADLDSARQQALAILERGEARNDPLSLLMGCRFAGVTHHPLGEFARAQALLERGIALYDPKQVATYLAITVDDPNVVMLMYLSWSLMCQGKLDEARRRSAQAVEWARRLGHAYSLAHALNGAAFVALTIESPHAGLRCLDELMPLLEEQGIAYYGAVGLLFRGWCLAALGEAAEAEARLREGMAAYRATGTTLYLSGFLRMSAEAHARIGRNSAALEQIHEAFQVMEATSQRWDEAEIHRVHGGLLLAAGDAEGAAASFRRAQAIARQQGAGLWELRATCDLARLRAEQGAWREAHDLVARVYAGFDGQADAPDVRGARSLVATLR